MKRIESHPHREALRADLQQNNVYNPFNKNSKEMIHEVGNVELFELCETIPEVQCSHCLLSSWQPYSNSNTTRNSWVFRRHVVGLSDEPPTLKPVVPEIVHRIQYGIAPKRLLLPYSDTEILSYIDDDISSIRDGNTAWVVSDATSTREHHMACRSSAVPEFRKANERRNPSPQRTNPSVRADTHQHSKLEPWVLTWQTGCH